MNTLALIVSIVGLLIYLILPTANPRPLEGKLSNAGFWAYAIGLAVFLLSAASLVRPI